VGQKPWQQPRHHLGNSGPRTALQKRTEGLPTLFGRKVLYTENPQQPTVPQPANRTPVKMSAQSQLPTKARQVNDLAQC